jgi:ketosteroid isomerase-like protein
MSGTHTCLSSTASVVGTPLDAPCTNKQHSGPVSNVHGAVAITAREASVETLEAVTYALLMSDPRAVIDRLTAAQNAHDLDAMVACFHEDYRSEQPIYPARTFQGIDQVRKNWSALLQGIPDFHSEIVRSAVEDDTVFVEVHWTGTKADGSPLEERGVLVMGIRDDRIAWGRLYAEEVEREGEDINEVVDRMAGTEDR